MKWGYILLFLAVIVLIPIALSIKNPAPISGMAVAENANEFQEFRTYTKAVCEKRNGFTYCHDEFFANCNGYEFMIEKDDARPIRCGSLVFKIPKNKVNGDGIFEENWKDPRYS